MKKISEYIVGEMVAGACLVLAEVSVRTTNTRPPRAYLSGSLTDGLDNIEFKVWSWDPNNKLPETKVVYEVDGTMGEYQGKKQITVTGMRRSADQDLSKFAPSIGLDLDVLIAEFKGYVTKIQNEPLKALLEAIYTSYEKELATAVSAKKVHHAYVGGHLQHSLEVTKLSLAIVDTLQLSEAIVNRDLLIAGSLIHDLGKLRTYEVSGPVIDYNDDGLLLDHIVKGICMLKEHETPDNEKLVRILTHIIASHHGKLEYGSPITPKLLEAQIISFADGISATVNTIEQAFKAAEPDALKTENIWSLGNQPIFTSKWLSDNV